MNRDNPAFHTKLAAFDLDGTLVDTNESLNDTGKQYLRERNLNPDDYEEFFREAVTMTDYEFTEGLLRFTGEYGKKTVEEALEEIEKGVCLVYKNLRETKPYVREYLSGLKKNGTKLIVLSATLPENIKLALNQAKLIEYFDDIFSATAEGMNKKDACTFSYVAERYGYKTEEMTLYDDSVRAIAAAKKAGCYAVAVGDELNGNNPENFPTADFFVKTLEELK